MAKICISISKIELDVFLKFYEIIECYYCKFSVELFMVVLILSSCASIYKASWF